MAPRSSGGGVGGRAATGRRSPAGSAPPPPPSLVNLGQDPLASLEQRSREIRDPVEKLRYLRRSLQRFEDVDQRLQAVPGAPLRWLAYRLTKVDRTRPLRSSNPNGVMEPPPPRSRALSRRTRRALNAAAVILVAAAGLSLAAYPRGRGLDLDTPSGAPEAPLAGGTLPVAESLPAAPRAIAPEGVWRVQGGNGYELYSNGLRIDTSYTVDGEPRRYRIFDVDMGPQRQVENRPVGIVYHTSESDIWPLEESFNGKLRDSSQNLLRYLRRNRVYHYLIDRFGQVFRVVSEETKANHVGNSVWSVGSRVYLNLNGSTLGVSFETRWEGGRALPITRAQLEAGRSLTDYLRHKWTIEPEMCLAHGLASVNPRKHLIGHHLDWARGFPFAAFGLPDQYALPSPAVAQFGFGHDDDLAERMGEPWPGVAAAERALATEASARGITVDALRREKRKRYDAWLAAQAALADSTGIDSAEAQVPRRHASGG